MNKVSLHGHVGKDPELKNTQQGKPFARFSFATTENWKDADGKKQSKTEWHQIVAWGKLGENVAKLVKKGQELILEGKLEYQTVADKDNADKKVTFTSIKLTTFDFCGKKENGGSGNYQPDPEPTGNESSYDSGSNSYEDDIPF